MHCIPFYTGMPIERAEAKTIQIIPENMPFQLPERIIGPMYTKKCTKKSVKFITKFTIYILITPEIFAILDSVHPKEAWL